MTQKLAENNGGYNACRQNRAASGVAAVAVDLEHFSPIGDQKAIARLLDKRLRRVPL